MIITITIIKITITATATLIITAVVFLLPHYIQNSLFNFSLLYAGNNSRNLTSIALTSHENKWRLISYIWAKKLKGLSSFKYPLLLSGTDCCFFLQVTVNEISLWLCRFGESIKCLRDYSAAAQNNQLNLSWKRNVFLLFFILVMMKFPIGTIPSFHRHGQVFFVARRQLSALVAGCT